jgi:hypothetical protein
MKFNFIKNTETYHGTEDSFYALQNGYINPDKMLNEEQAKIVIDAANLVEEFLSQAYDAGLIGEDNYDEEE